MITDNQYLARIREFLNDTGADHRVAPDDMTAQCDSVKLTLFAANKNLVGTADGAPTEPLLQRNGGGYLSTGFTVNKALGMFTLTGTPPATLQALYYYQYFSDTEIADFRNHGLERVSVNGTDAVARGNVDAILLSVVAHYAAAFGYEKLASKYSTQFNASAEGASADKSALYDHYMELAKHHKEQAEVERLAYYGNRQERSTVASVAISASAYPGGNYTPKR